MKKRLSVILVLALVFTTVFSVNPAFANEYEEWHNELEFYFDFSVDYDEYYSVQITTQEELDEALSMNGLDIVVPYGFISDYDGKDHIREVAALAIVSSSSNISDISLEEADVSEDGEYKYYYEEYTISDIKYDDKNTIAIGVTRDGKYVETYVFNFIEDEGDALDITGLYFEYCDIYGSWDSEYVDLEEDLDSAKKGINILLPSYYDNSQGISIYYYTDECVLQDNIKSTYYLSNNKASFTLNFKSANGKNSINFPVTIKKDTDETSTSLEEVQVNCYEYNDDGTYFDEYFYANPDSLDNDFNEIYVEIPSYYYMYNENDDYEGTVYTENVENITLMVSSKGSARIDCSYTEDGYYYEEYYRDAYWNLEEYFAEGYDTVYATFNVYSGNMEEVESYTVYTIISDCEGEHNFSNWKVSEADLYKDSYKTRKCSDCPYVEKKRILDIDNFAVSNNATNGKPKLTWDKCDEASKYYVYRATSKDGTYSYLRSTTSTSYIDNSAETGKVYYYKVKAIDANGNAGEYSDIKYTRCDLPQPTGVKMNNIASTGKPEVVWTKVSGADKYYVYRATSKDGTYSYLGSTAKTYYADNTAEVGKVYYYKVRAVYSANENANSAQSSYAYTRCDLPQPIGVKMNNISLSGKPEVVWTKVSGADKYYVYRATSKNGTYSYLRATTKNYYTDETAVAGKVYYYKVRAVYSTNENANSAQSSYAYTRCDLPQPTDLKMTNVVSSGKLQVSWNVVPGADKYYVYRAASKDGTYSYLNSTTKTYYVDNTTVAGKIYYYKVRAVYSANENANSVQSSYTYARCDLAQPTGVRMNNVASTGKPEVVWTKVAGADKYYVYRATSKDGTYSYLGSTAKTYYADNTAEVGKVYYYKVRAVYSANENANSAQSSYAYVRCDLKQPTGLKISTATSNGKPQITWTAVPNADKYYVYRAASKDGTYSYLRSTTSTSYIDTSATSGKTYYYKVRAVYSANEYANSAQSSYVSITSK